MSNGAAIHGSEEHKELRVPIDGCVHKLLVIEKDINVPIIIPKEPDATEETLGLNSVRMEKAYFFMILSALTPLIRGSSKTTRSRLYLSTRNLKALKKGTLSALWQFIQTQT